MPKPYKPTPYDLYQNKRSYLIDTAETPEDKKRLKADLAKLDAAYKASRNSAGITGKAGKNVGSVYRNMQVK